jgi:hypothetical protein
VFTRKLVRVFIWNLAVVSNETQREWQLDNLAGVFTWNPVRAFKREPAVALN